MAATFDDTLHTPKDEMRAALGDRDVPDNALRQDEEYVATLALADGSVPLATAVMAEGLAAEYAQRPDSFSSAGDFAVSWRERVRTWLALAASIRTHLASGPGAAAANAVGAWAVRGDRPAGAEYCRPGCGPVWWTR